MNTTTETWILYSRNALKLNKWTNIAFTWEDLPELGLRNIRTYINGILKQSSTSPRESFNVPVRNTGDFYIGSAFNNSNYSFQIVGSINALGKNFIYFYLL